MVAFSIRSITLALVAIACATTATSAQEHQQEQGHMTRELKAQIEAQYQAAMLVAVNAERAKQGLSAFCTNKKLQAAAQLHSEDQAKNNFMSHTGSSGSTMSQRITAQGFKWNGAAENVAAGQADVTSVMQSWMKSDGHRANILGKFKYFGTGYAYSASSTYKHYWTQNFGSGDGESCDGDDSVTPVYTPAPATKSPPATKTPPATKPPVYTSSPATKAPIDQRPRPPVTTSPPVITSSPTVTPATKPHTPNPAAATKPYTPAPSSTTGKPTKKPKTDCKPIY